MNSKYSLYHRELAAIMMLLILVPCGYRHGIYFNINNTLLTLSSTSMSNPRTKVRTGSTSSDAAGEGNQPGNEPGTGVPADGEGLPSVDTTLQGQGTVPASNRGNGIAQVTTAAQHQSQNPNSPSQEAGVEGTPGVGLNTPGEISVGAIAQALVAAGVISPANNNAAGVESPAAQNTAVAQTTAAVTSAGVQSPASLTTAGVQTPAVNTTAGALTPADRRSRIILPGSSPINPAGGFPLNLDLPGDRVIYNTRLEQLRVEHQQLSDALAIANQNAPRPELITPAVARVVVSPNVTSKGGILVRANLVPGQDAPQGSILPDRIDGQRVNGLLASAEQAAVGYVNSGNKLITLNKIPSGYSIAELGAIQNRLQQSLESRAKHARYLTEYLKSLRAHEKAMRIDFNNKSAGQPYRLGMSNVQEENPGQ